MDFIKSAIAKMIYNNFGNDVKIYSEMIEQGFLRPCFFICIDNGKFKKFLDKDKTFCFKCHIYFFPEKSEQLNEEMMDASFKLFDGCEKIYLVCNKLKYLDANYSIKDDRLIFNVDFKMKIDNENEFAFMERLFSNENVKNYKTKEKLSI